MDNKRGWSWMGFLFAPHYYAGYGQLKKGLILAVISGIMPFVAIAVGIYGGLKARKELPIKEMEFIWKNVVWTVVTVIVVSFISLSIISGMKGNGTGSAKNSGTSESVSGNGEAMPLTEENLKSYEAKVHEVIKDKYDLEDGQAISTQMMSAEDQKKLFRDTLEDMGYDYDATILEAIKMDHQNGNDTYVNKLNIPSDTSEAVKIGWITDDTAKKLALYGQYKDIKDIHTTIKLCEIEIECENMGQGICYGGNLKKLLDTNFNIVQSVSSGYRDVFKTYDPTLKMNSGDTPELFSCNDGYGDNDMVFCIDRDGSDNYKITMDRNVYHQLQDTAKLIWWQ